MNQTIEQTIINNLITNEDFSRKVIPFLKSEYFSIFYERIVFEEIQKYILKYKTIPTNESIAIEIDNRKSISEEDYQNAMKFLNGIEKTDVDNEWLVDAAEKFCKDKAVYHAVLSGIQIIDGKDKNRTADAIPDILTQALSVSFDSSVGHDYIEDGDNRYEFYHKKEKRIEFDLDYFNRITKGGLPTKSLNIAIAGTGVGKSLFMCHVAASTLMQGKNVLYITMEMAEERIAERIDVNLMDVTMDELHDLPKQMFDTSIEKLRKKTEGKLIIKEYPTASAHSGHFRALLKELSIKKSFKPDIIFIDYLNICASSRMKGMGGSINSYSYIKAIAEELRGLAVEFDVPIVSATQTTRSGFVSSDIGLEDTSESFGLPATADFMFALISNEDLEELGQIIVKQLKNRYNDPNINKRFVVGINRAKMKLYDVEENAQKGIVDNGQKGIAEKVEKPMTANKFDKFSNLTDIKI
jgi:replicative DNA helicase